MPIEDETEQLRRFSTHPACQNGGSSRVRIHIQTEGPQATCSAGLSLFSFHPETPVGYCNVSDLETKNFSQDQGNQAFVRRCSALRRTIKCVD